MAKGTVKFFNYSRGFGFIEPDDGSKDAFVHISAVEQAGMSSLSEGQKVSYDLQPGKNGKSSAENLVDLTGKEDTAPAAPVAVAEEDVSDSDEAGDESAEDEAVSA